MIWKNGKAHGRKYKAGHQLDGACIVSIDEFDDCTLLCECGNEFENNYQTIKNKLCLRERMVCRECREHGKHKHQDRTSETTSV